MGHCDHRGQKQFPGTENCNRDSAFCVAGMLKHPHRAELGPMPRSGLCRFQERKHVDAATTTNSHGHCHSVVTEYRTVAEIN